MKWENAIFVVTGGASGIGEATTRMAVANGAKVAIWDLENQQKRADKIIGELGAAKVIFCPTNVTLEESVDSALAATMKAYGAVHCCVNCAGIGAATATVGKNFKPHPMDAFTRIVTINCIGSFLTGSRCAAQMAQQDPNADGERGCVINIASIAAFDGQNGQAGYSASKAGVVGMTLPMARDLGRYGIRVNTICPGLVDTPMAGVEVPIDNREVGKMDRVGKSLITSQAFPVQRFARPAEMAHLAKFMFESPFMNGEHVRLDAGNRMPKL